MAPDPPDPLVQTFSLLMASSAPWAAAGQPSPSERAMSMRCTSLVPSPISRIFASR